jgi:hypothetical protein
MRLETIYTMLFIIFCAIVVPWAIVAVVEAISKIVDTVSGLVAGLKHNKTKQSKIKLMERRVFELELWLMNNHPGSLTKFEEYFDSRFKNQK